MSEALLTLQRTFKDGILAEDLSRIAQNIKPSESYHRDERLEIYRNNMFSSLKSVLAETFPKVETLVGKEFFAHTAHEFIKLYPPTKGELLAYGETFPGFLRTFKPARNLVYLGDVAQVEWLSNEAEYSADAPPLTLEALQKIPAETYPRLQFSLMPSARFFASAYPLKKIWKVLNQAEEEKIQLTNERTQGIVIRPKSQVEVHWLCPAKHAFLKVVSRMGLFKEAAEAALSVESTFDLQTFLAFCLQEGFFQGVFFTSAAPKK